LGFFVPLFASTNANGLCALCLDPELRSPGLVFAGLWPKRQNRTEPGPQGHKPRARVIKMNPFPIQKYLLPSGKTYLLSSEHLLTDYSLILIFFAISAVISCLIFGLSYFFSSRSIDKEKISAYECGFNPFEDARNQFDVRFYLVAILFIIFDLEVSFLFPWAITLNRLTLFGFW
jgi:NADH:ubiquinone oxidoreductase subunit 3 (subunit A)